MTKKIISLLVCLVLSLSYINIYASDTEQSKEPTVPILLYHAIEENYPNEISNLAITTKRFEEHMQALLREGYTTISFKEFMDYKYNATPLPPKPIIIAFDDGYLSNYTKAYPILKKYQMKATIFIVASTVGKKYPEVNYSHFTWAEAREMQQSGIIEIGSHTYYHNDVSTYTTDKAAMDIRLSKYLIDTNLNYNCTLLAFPYGHCTEENRQQALDAGYEISCIVGDVGVNTKDTPITALKRLTVYGGHTADDLLWYIETETERELSGYYD